MERTRPRLRRRTWVALGIAAMAVLLWDVIVTIGMQLLAASLLCLAALPLCRTLDRRLPPGPAAALSLAMLLVLAILALMLFVPPLMAQLEQLAAALPGLLAELQSLWTRLSDWMTAHQLDASSLRDGIFRQVTDGAGALLSSLLGSVTRFLGALSKVLLAPLLAFYMLRDRKRFSAWAMSLIPQPFREQAALSLRMIRREMSAYFRGQLLLCLSVGALTAVGLLLAGTPGWLLLGVLMGVMELIPYVGPFLAGTPAVLLALQGGWLRALWALGAILAVQQIESAFLSPRLLGNAARLHPMAVLLLVSAAGILAGPLGMLLVIPAVIALRGAWHGWRAARGAAGAAGR